MASNAPCTSAARPARAATRRPESEGASGTGLPTVQPTPCHTARWQRSRPVRNVLLGLAVSLPGRKIARSNLWLAYTPSRRASVPPRALLIVRAILVRIRLLALNVVAVCGAISALLPLLVRRRPLG